MGSSCAGFEVTILGSGTSHGVPMIGCSCAVCLCANPKNRRYRPSIFINSSQAHILVDAPPELRLQLIENNISKIDAVLLTHSHADHIYGLDDLRRISEINKAAVPIYGEKSVLNDIKRAFQYVFEPADPGGGKPKFMLKEIDSCLKLGDLNIETLRGFHGELPVLIFKIGDFAYATDISHIPAETEAKLHNLKFLILDAVRYSPHPTHYHLDAALKVIERIKPERTALTHLSHDYDHDLVNAQLPKGVELAYDGMKVQM